MAEISPELELDGEAWVTQERAADLLDVELAVVVARMPGYVQMFHPDDRRVALIRKRDVMSRGMSGMVRGLPAC